MYCTFVFALQYVKLKTAEFCSFDNNDVKYSRLVCSVAHLQIHH